LLVIQVQARVISASGNIVKNAQEQGIFVVLIDSENALDEDWLKALGCGHKRKQTVETVNGHD
jgi:ABC-type sugar transport system substrate-binding protein